MTIYIDTSALAKWYLREQRSEEAERFILSHAPLAISGLTVVEMRCLLARRRRERWIDRRTEARVFAVFEQDIREGHLVRHAVSDEVFSVAARLIDALHRTPLRSLDAVHLAVAQEIHATTLATADRVMVAAARALRLRVVRFDRGSGRSR